MSSVSARVGSPAAPRRRARAREQYTWLSSAPMSLTFAVLLAFCTGAPPALGGYHSFLTGPRPVPTMVDIGVARPNAHR